MFKQGLVLSAVWIGSSAAGTINSAGPPTLFQRISREMKFGFEPAQMGSHG